MGPFQEYYFFHEPPVEIEQDKRGMSYTIKLIGGPVEYAQYLLEKKERLERSELAKREAFITRKILLTDIVRGIEAPSADALKRPATLARFQAQMSGKPVQQYVQADVMFEQPLPTPTWYERVCEKVKKVLTF